MKPCKRYTEEFISRFMDREVSPADREAYTRHRNDCMSCREREAAFRELTRVFQRHTDLQVRQIQEEQPPISATKPAGILDRITGRLPGRLPGSGWIGFKRYAKLASLGAVAVVLAAVISPGTFDRTPEPTAIVNSLDTYGSSVMIIETPDTQHTIIWFSET